MQDCFFGVTPTWETYSSTTSVFGFFNYERFNTGLLRDESSTAIVSWAMVIGAFTNSSLFLLYAIFPVADKLSELYQEITFWSLAFTIYLYSSLLLTSYGFEKAAVLIFKSTFNEKEYVAKNQQSSYIRMWQSPSRLIDSIELKIQLLNGQHFGIFSFANLDNQLLSMHHNQIFVIHLFAVNFYCALFNHS